MSIELVISGLALIVSVGSVWITVFHRGTVKMTRPQFFALLPENGPFGSWIKFFTRVLVFSTGQRGRVIENLYVTIHHNNKELPFHYWMYGETDKLTIGSGVFVGHQGLAANHHFVPTTPVSSNDFTAGSYKLEISTLLLGDRWPIQLFEIQFNLNDEEVAAIRNSKDHAIFFIWDKNNNVYKSRIDTRKKLSQELL